MRRGPKDKILSAGDVSRLRELRKQQIPISICAEELYTSERVIQRTLVLHGMAGRLCPNCGHAIPSGTIGQPKPRRVVRGKLPNSQTLENGFA
jgi:hypothetical protein